MAGEYNIHGLKYLALEKGRAAIRDEPETSVLIECIPKVHESVIGQGYRIFDEMIESIRERIRKTPLDSNARNILDSTMQEVPRFARYLAMSFATQQP